MASYWKTKARWWDVPSRSPLLRRREFEALAGLVTFFRARGDPWQVGASGFEARLRLSEPGPTGVVVYKVHVVGWEDPRARFYATVTLWPRSSVRKQSARSKRAATAWRSAVTGALERHGYRGEWHVGKYRFGDFWKRLKSMSELKAEVRRLRTGRLPLRGYQTREQSHEHGAVEQGDEADEAGASDGASQRIPGVRRTWRKGGTT